MNKEKGEKSHSKEKIALFYYKHSFLRKKHAPRTTHHVPFSVFYWYATGRHECVY